MKNAIAVNGDFMSIADFEKANGLVVEGGVYLRGTTITHLPDNLSVGGFLYLNRTKITCLPDNLSVGGFLDLSHTNIDHLPDDLKVAKDLCLEGTEITYLPDELNLGGYVCHSKHLILETKYYTYITGLFWPIKIYGKSIHIGCKKHTIDEWDKFTDKEIDDMDHEALEFWKEHKELIMSEAQKSQL